MPHGLARQRAHVPRCRRVWEQAVHQWSDVHRVSVSAECSSERNYVQRDVRGPASHPCIPMCMCRRLCEWSVLRRMGQQVSSVHAAVSCWLHRESGRILQHRHQRVRVEAMSQRCLVYRFAREDMDQWHDRTRCVLVRVSSRLGEWYLCLRLHLGIYD